jgi:hypothetical protein
LLVAPTGFTLIDIPLMLEQAMIVGELAFCEHVLERIQVIEGW